MDPVKYRFIGQVHKSVEWLHPCRLKSFNLRRFKIYVTMRILVRSVIFITLSIIVHSSSAQFTYISPVPGSKMNNKETNIILRTGNFIDAASLKNNLVAING